MHALAAAPGPAGQNRVTLDDIFRRVAQRRPGALALADPPNRMTFTDGAPRRLTFAEADRMVTAIAGRLRQMGLSTDAIVGIQLPNTVENILALLGVMRAGMIAAPLPLLWRRADTIAALARLGGKALITCGHVGAFNHCQFAMRVAAEVFSIRYVCGFGDALPDGVVPFDDLFTAAKIDPVPPLEREGQNAAHIAAITFDVGEGGVVPVARNHLELLAGGLGVLLESRLAQDGIVLSTLAPASFAGLCMTLLPWLLCGGTLLLHHPFDPAALVGQWRGTERCGALILPGPLAFRLAEAGVFSRYRSGLRGGDVAFAGTAVGKPALGTSATVPSSTSLLFGETGLVAARRGFSGRAAPLPLGPIVAPRGSPGALRVAELIPTQRNTVGLRGPMVPRQAFPPGAERAGFPHFAVGPGGVVDTGFACQIDAAARTAVVTGAPPGIVSVGGYRFPLQDLQDVVSRIDPAATLAALPDPLLGERLAGNAADRYTIQAALNAVGVNPIAVAAFHDRSDRAIAAQSSHG